MYVDVGGDVCVDVVWTYVDICSVLRCVLCCMLCCLYILCVYVVSVACKYSGCYVCYVCCLCVVCLCAFYVYVCVCRCIYVCML